MVAIGTVKVLPLRGSLMRNTIVGLIVSWAWIFVEWARFSLISHGILRSFAKI